MTELLKAGAAGAAAPDAASGDQGAPDTAVVARGTEVVVLRGRILQVEPQRVLVEWNNRQYPVPWERLGGLIFAHAATRTAPSVVRLNTGDALAGEVVGGGEATLQIRCAAFEHELEIPWSSVERIDCHSDRLVVLSELKPTRYEFEPFFEKTWDYAADATLTGQPIRLGGRSFPRGLSMHSRSRLVYALDGQFERFTATAGILDEMGRRGCVALRVHGDGRVLWSATGVCGGEAPREVSVDIAGVRELTLEVDYDADLDLSDQAAWGFARLIR